MVMHWGKNGDCICGINGIIFSTPKQMQNSKTIPTKRSRRLRQLVLFASFCIKERCKLNFEDIEKYVVFERKLKTLKFPDKLTSHV